MPAREKRDLGKGWKLRKTFCFQGLSVDGRVSFVSELLNVHVHVNTKLKVSNFVNCHTSYNFLPGSGGSAEHSEGCAL